MSRRISRGEHSEVIGRKKALLADSQTPADTKMPVLADAAVSDRHSFPEFGAKSREQFINNSQKNSKFDEETEKIGESIVQSRKNVFDFWLKC